MEIKYFRSASGRKPVEEKILSLSEKVVFKVAETLDLIRVYGPLQLFKSGELKKIKPYDLLELKIRGLQYRILCIINSSKFWLLHIFLKKRRKIEPRHIKTALKRARKMRKQFEESRQSYTN